MTLLLLVNAEYCFLAHFDSFGRFPFDIKRIAYCSSASLSLGYTAAFPARDDGGFGILISEAFPLLSDIVFDDFLPPRRGLGFSHALTRFDAFGM